MDTLQHIIPQIKQKYLQRYIVKIMNLLIINIEMNYSFGMAKRKYPCRYIGKNKLVRKDKEIR